MQLHIGCTEALFADFAPVPRLLFLAVESIIKAEVQLSGEWAITPELLSFLEQNIMIANAMIFTRDHDIVLDLTPEMLLFFFA